MYNGVKRDITNIVGEIWNTRQTDGRRCDYKKRTESKK